jgi:nucleoside-diphosphate-sugar epimerase
LADADRWQLHLRPTVVYGPFCRPWTDRIFEAFRQGNVRYADLSGRIQPVYGEDVSRFIYERLLDFRPGIYNFPGPEEMSWQTFVDTFREIVGIGNLVRVPVAPGNRARTKPGFVERALRKAERTVRPVAASAAEQRRANAKLFAKPFFAEDRLLSDAKWRRDCPTFQLSRLSEVKDVLAEYYRARFPDDRRA